MIRRYQKGGKFRKSNFKGRLDRDGRISATAQDLLMPSVLPTCSLPQNFAVRRTVEQMVDRGWNSAPWRIAAWTMAVALMLVPITVRLIGGPFGWSLGDFLLVATILIAGCLLFDWAARKASNLSYLSAVGAALAAGFGLVVVNGAVGLVGSEDEAHNLLFGFVLLVALFGFVLARGRPAGAARAMFAASALHALISVGLLLTVAGSDTADPRAEWTGLSVFAALWLGSALLFRYSAR